MMRVLTDVFPPEIKPVRDGWYLFTGKGDVLFCLREFRDGAWRWAETGDPIHIQHCTGWRGLAFDPAGAFDHDSWNWKEPGNIESGGYEQGVFVPGATCC